MGATFFGFFELYFPVKYSASRQNWLANYTNLDYNIPFLFGHEFMADQQQCKNCEQRHSCKEVYRQMSDPNGPKVLSKVIQAFLVPLVIFIFSAFAADRFLAEKLKSDPVRNLAVLATAVTVVLLYIIILNSILRFRRRKN